MLALQFRNASGGEFPRHVCSRIQSCSCSAALRCGATSAPDSMCDGPMGQPKITARGSRAATYKSHAIAGGIRMNLPHAGPAHARRETAPSIPGPPKWPRQRQTPLPPGLIRSTRPPPKWPGQRQTPPSFQPESFNHASPQRARAEANPFSPLNSPSPQMTRAEGRTSSPGPGCSTPPPPKWQGQKQTPLPPGRQEPTQPPEIWSSTADAERGAYAERWYVDSGVCKINARYVCSIITSASPPSPRSSKLKGKRRSRLT